MKNVTLKDKMGPSLQGPIWCSRLDVTWLQSLLAKLNCIYISIRYCMEKIELEVFLSPLNFTGNSIW